MPLDGTHATSLVTQMRGFGQGFTCTVHVLVSLTGRCRQMSTAFTVAVSVTSLSQSAGLQVGLVPVFTQLWPGSRSGQVNVCGCADGHLEVLSGVSVIVTPVRVTFPSLRTVIVKGIGSPG